MSILTDYKAQLNILMDATLWQNEGERGEQLEVWVMKIENDLQQPYSDGVKVRLHFLQQIIMKEVKQI